MMTTIPDRRYDHLAYPEYSNDVKNNVQGKRGRLPHDLDGYGR